MIALNRWDQIYPTLRTLLHYTQTRNKKWSEVVHKHTSIRKVVAQICLSRYPQRTKCNKAMYMVNLVGLRCKLLSAACVCANALIIGYAINFGSNGCELFVTYLYFLILFHSIRLCLIPEDVKVVIVPVDIGLSSVHYVFHLL